MYSWRDARHEESRELAGNRLLQPQAAKEVEAPSTIPLDKLEIDPEVQRLLPRARPEDYRALLGGIQNEGVRQPVVIDQHGVLTDGHTRWQIAIELGLPTLPCVVHSTLDGADRARQALALNLQRRNLTNPQKAEVALRFVEIERVAAKSRQGARNDIARTLMLIDLEVPSVVVEEEFGRTVERVAPLVGLSPTTLAKWIKVEQVSAWDSTTRGLREEALAYGKLSVHKVYSIARRAELILRLREGAASDTQFDSGSGVVTGDAFQVLESRLVDGSVSLVLTDPPWEKSWLEYWGELGGFAAKKLRICGWLLTYAPKHFLDRVHAALREHLRLETEIAIEEIGSDLVLRNQNIRSQWQPGLAYRRPPGRPLPRQASDLIVSPAREKSHHPWQQSLGPVSYLVEHYSEPGELVVDPFVGGGTTGVACKQLGRRFIGAELDEKVAALARQRIETNPPLSGDAALAIRDEAVQTGGTVA